MELNVWVAQYTNFWGVEPFDLGFPAAADRRDQVANFEPHVCHHEAKYRQHGNVDHLHDELREVTVEQPTYAVGAIRLDEGVADHTVPPCAVLTGGEDA